MDNDYNKIYYDKRRQELLFRLGNSCNKCGSTENLEFDHVDPSTKLHSISKILYRADLLEDELGKCQLLCKPCHVEKTRAENKKRIEPYRSAHGTVRRYCHYGCRCKSCKKAYSNYKKDYRTRKGSQKKGGSGKRKAYGRPATHGEVLNYYRGCRCKKCKSAKARVERDYRAKRNQVREHKAP